MTEPMGAEASSTFQIGEIADRIGLSQRTIRHYDDLGIVKPSARTTGGFRLYTEADVNRFLLIKPFKPLGIGLDAVRAVLEAFDALGDESTSDERLAAARVQVEAIIALIAERRAELEDAIVASETTVSELRQALSPAASHAAGGSGTG